MSDWLEAEQRVERAQQLSESRRWGDALQELEAAIAINPANALWHAQRGVLLEELSRCNDAINAYRRSLELDPYDREVSLALGTCLARQGNYARALEVFVKLSETDRDFEPAYCHRIQIYAELGQHDRAEEMFYLAQEIEERCPHCFYHLGGSLAARGKTDRALFCYNRTLELDPMYAGVHRRIGLAYRAKGDLKKARAHLLEELRDDPGNSDILLDLAELAIAAQDWRSAACKYEQIIELQPDHEEAFFELGKLWLGRGNPEKALLCFERAEELCDSEMILCDLDWHIGEAMVRTRRLEEARTRLERAVTLDPQNPAILHLLGDVLLTLERPQDAAKYCRRVLSRDESDAIAHHKLGICLVQMGRSNDAIVHFLRAIEAKPDLSDAMLSAALAYVQLGKWRAARQMLNKVKACSPDDADARELSRNLWRYRFRALIKQCWGYVRHLGSRVSRSSFSGTVSHGS